MRMFLLTSRLVAPGLVSELFLPGVIHFHLTLRPQRAPHRLFLDYAFPHSLSIGKYPYDETFVVLTHNLDADKLLCGHGTGYLVGHRVTADLARVLRRYNNLDAAIFLVAERLAEIRRFAG
jgi:hypothetical protein